MGKNKNKKSRLVVDQAGEISSTGLVTASGQEGSVHPAPSRHDDRDTLVISNVPQSYSYHRINQTMKAFGRILRIRLLYDGDSDNNKCYIVYANCESAKSASQAPLDQLVTTSGGGLGEVQELNGR